MLFGYVELAQLDDDSQASLSAQNLSPMSCSLGAACWSPEDPNGFASITLFLTCAHLTLSLGWDGSEKGWPGYSLKGKANLGTYCELILRMLAMNDLAFRGMVGHMS